MSWRSKRRGRLAALWLLVRPARADLSSAALPVVTFAIMTAVVLAVTVVARAYWTALDPEGFGQYKILAVQYKVLAVAMPAVLVVPTGTLGGAAARLWARRREDRLATLRLMGASAPWVRGVALVEVAFVAAAGALLGLLLYLPLVPALALVQAAGQPLGLAGAWLPAGLIVVLLLGIVLMAMVSAGGSLRLVLICPLGVGMRQSAPRMHWLPVVIALVFVAGAVLVLQLALASWAAVGITTGLVVVLVALVEDMTQEQPGEGARR